MAATMRISDGDEWLPGVRWKYHFYYHHCEDLTEHSGGRIEDFGFFADDGDDGIGYSRVIRDAARKLHDAGTEPCE